MAREWALVTGASSGIGREIARLLSGECNLVLCGRDEKRLAETAAACSPGCETRVWVRDLTDVAELGDALAGFLAREKIVVSRFVHAAGLSRILPLSVTRPEDVEASFRVNAFAPLFIVRTLATKRLNGDALRSVVFISSALAQRGAQGHAVYGGSKAALCGFMRSLAVELAPKVRVNAVLPGFVKTPMTASVLANGDVAARLKAQYPLGLGEPKSVAEAVAFLLSDRAGWITGQELVIDGGMSVDISA